MGEEGKERYLFNLLERRGGDVRVAAELRGARRCESGRGASSPRDTQVRARPQFHI